jgi:hypothetical protein
MSSCFNDQNCTLFYLYLKAYVSSTSTDGRKEEPKSVLLHKLKAYASSTSADGRKEEPKIVQLQKLSCMK